MNVRQLALFPFLVGLGGCAFETAHTGPTRHEDFTVERDNSEFLRVNVHMAAGELKVAGGTDKFLDGTLTYNVDAWKPVLKYSTAAGHGNVSIDQPKAGHGNIGKMKYEWDLRLAEDIPVDLAVRFGAGEARLDLGNLLLRSVDLEIGVGRVEMDLRGDPKRSYEVRVRGGVGEVTIRLPKDAGVQAKAEGGIGAIKTRGLRREGGRLVNDAYDYAKTTIRLDVQGGIGAINLIAD
jgi:hypothetical protein